MRIISSEISRLEIPLKTAFSHASATRKKTDSVLVMLRSENGLIGFGEGCPRSYVTGETWESACEFFEDIKLKIQQIHSIETLKAFVAHHEVEINKSPAAWCALELAILDLLGKENNQTIEELLSLPELSGEFRYSAVIGTKHILTFFIQTVLYKIKGFTDFKIKIFGNLKSDRRRIHFLKFVVGNGLRLRLDANNLWTDATEAIQYIEKLDLGIFAVEEPLVSGKYEALRTLGKELETNVILDESFLRLDQFDFLSKDSIWIINVRISKMGGLIRTKMICEEAQRRGVSIIVGAQVGETSVLTKAALTIANAFRSILLSQEGAFGTYLLTEDPFEPSIRFGKSGLVKADEVTSKGIYGFGLLSKKYGIHI